MISKRVASLLIALLLLVGAVIVPASAADQAVVQMESSYMAVGIDEVSIISAKISDGADCKINFISTSDLVTIGETVYNGATHISSATVKGNAAGQDMILAVAEGNYSNGVCVVTVPKSVADGNVVNHTLNSGTASSNDNSSPTAEMPVKAFDNSVDTKWLIFNNTGWLQYRFDNAQRYVVNAYIVASANDDDIRDPVDWELLGSNDGATWDVLDTRTGEDFESRKLKRTFYIDNNEAYEYYRFNITKNSGDYRTQISELQLLEYGDNTASPDVATLPDNQIKNLTLNPGTVQAVESNSPEYAFDNSLDTNWSVSGNEGWLQYQFNNGSYVANAYMIASAVGVENLSIGATATASSTDSAANINNALDGNPSTRFTTQYADNQWYLIDFGREVTFNTVAIDWEVAHSKDYVLEYSNNGTEFTQFLSEPNCPGGNEIKTFDAVTARYLRISMGGRATKWGHSFWEFAVYNASAEDLGLIIDNSAADPKSWEILGSNDGEKWDVLDSRSNEAFGSRKLQKYYAFDNNKAYSYYRLNITENNGNAKTHIAELQLINYLADKSSLNALIDKANAIDTSALSNASAKMLDEMLTYAESVNNKTNASQNNVNKAAAEMQKMLDTIVYNSAYYAKADKDEYVINETITIELATSTDVSRICLYNEYGKYVGVLSSDYEDIGNIRYWTVTTSVGSKGIRTLSIFAKNSTDEIKDTNLTVSFNVVKNANVAPALIEATMLTASPVKVNQAFNLQVVTTTSVDKICIANENGKYLGNTASYVDNGTTRTWNISLSVGTAGNREFIIQAKSNGTMLEDNLNLSMVVTK